MTGVLEEVDFGGQLDASVARVCRPDRRDTNLSGSAAEDPGRAGKDGGRKGTGPGGQGISPIRRPSCMNALVKTCTGGRRQCNCARAFPGG